MRGHKFILLLLLLSVLLPAFHISAQSQPSVDVKVKADSIKVISYNSTPRQSGTFGDDDQNNPSTGGDSGGVFGDSDQNNPTTEGSSGGGFSDSDMGGGIPLEEEKYITFADSSVKALCVTNWDTNGDGELSEDEAAAVTTLGEVFKNNADITSFDELQYFTGLSEIADYAFNECKNLESVILPSEVTRIGHWAFLTCSNLNTIVIPANVIDIGAGAFAGCINMISITVDTENTVYDSREDCNAIIHSSTNTVVAGCKNMIIPEGVTSIGDWALNGMGSLTSVVLPSSLTSIGTGAFSWCWSLPSITIPANVTSIGSSSFEGCGNLTSVIVENPEPVAIEESTFSNRANATLTVPFPTKYLYEAADYWKEFKEIVQMEGPIAIGDTFPAPVPCDEVTTDLTFKVTNVSPLEVEVMSSPEDIAGAVTIPATVEYNGLQFAVKAIGDNAFRTRPNLQAVDLPEGITTIKESAFRESGLESIKFPTTLTEIGENAFHSCSSIKSIDFNDASIKLNAQVFWGCTSLEEVYIPRNVKIIGWNLFCLCTSLKSAIFEEKEDNNGWEPSTVFNACSSLETVVVPFTSMMGDKFFLSCSSLKSVTFLRDDAPVYNSRNYAKYFRGVPDDVFFTIPDGTAENFLRRGYKNLSDKSGLPLVREEFEAEAARITTMADGLSDGDKVALTAAISEARTTVNATDDYMTVYAQIAAIKTAARVFIGSASLPEGFDVTAATITNPDIDRFDIGWKVSFIASGVGYYIGTQSQQYTHEDVTIDHFIEAWNGAPTPVSDGQIFQTITIPAGIYRLEADIIATNQSDANAEVTGVSLFAGSTKTAVATENEKPQHFSVEFTQYEDADCTIGIDVANTNANWVAMDNVRLYRLGGEVPAAVIDANETYYLQNVETGKFLNQGNSWGTHAVLKDEGLPLRITRLPDGSYTFYFLEGSAREHLLFRTGPSNVYVDYNSSDANQCPYWTITATDVEGIFHIQSLITDSRYGQQVYPGTYLGNNPTKEAVNHDGTHFGVYNDVDGDITDTEGMNLKWRFVKQDWFNIAVNSDMEGTDNVCFFSSENYPEDEEIAPSTIVEGAGVDGSRGIVIHSVDNPTNVYDSQFFFRLPQTLPAGTKYRISFDYKASQETSGRTETHAEPGKFSSLNCIGDINYSTDWKHFELIGTVSAEQSPADNPMRTIAFDLANTPTSTTYYFDNVVFEIDRNQITPLAIVAEAPTAKEVAYTGAAQELVNPGRALFGTMQYSLDGTNFSTTIPTGTDVGEYTVYYKVMGDEDHGDTEAATVIVTLAQPDNLLYADNVSVCRGSRVVLPISLKNDDAVNMVDFYLQLPEGMSIADGSDGNPDVSLVSGRSNKHVVTAQLKEAGRYHIVCYSSQNNAFNDNDGALFNITLACDEDVVVGSYEGTVMNILMSDTDRNSHVQPNFTFNIEVPDLQLGDVNNDGNINGLDIVEMVDHIMHRPSENFHFATADLHCDNKINGLDLVKLVKLVLDQDITQNASHAPAMRRNAPKEGWLTLKDNGRGSLTMGIDSSDGFILAQCVVEVSEGMQLKDITADGNHLVAWQPIDEHRYAVVAYSVRNDVFGTNKTLLAINYTGKGNISISNTMLVDSGRNERHFAPAGLDVVTGLEAVGMEGSADTYDLQGRKMTDGNLPKGVYIVNGKKVIVR